MKRAALIAAAALCLGAGVDDFEVTRGALSPGARAGVLVGCTDANGSGFSYGRFVWRRAVEAPYEVAMRVRRLGGDAARSVELELPGAIVMLDRGRVGLYRDETDFAVRGWQDAPALDGGEHTITVVHAVDAVTVAVDGAVIARFDVALPARGQVAIGFKGAPGARSRLRISDFALRSR